MSAAEQTPTVVSFGMDVLERMALAVERVQERLHRATAALEAAGLQYAVIGGNAVAAWVSRIDPGLARNTVDVDVMINRAELGAVKTAMEAAGFVYHEVYGVHMFLDGPDGRPSEAVHILFANEKVRSDYVAPAPSLSDTEQEKTFRVLALEPLVRMKLTSYRRKDQVHVQDLIKAGMVDGTWIHRFPRGLAARLQELLDDPEG